MPTLLVVDDEANVRYSLERSLCNPTLRVVTAPCAKDGIELAETERPDAVLLDVRLPDMSGLDAFERIHAVDARIPVIIMTAYSTTETAIEAMKRGAFEYLLKPVDLRQLRETVVRAFELNRLMHVPAVFEVGSEAEAGASADLIVGRSPSMQEVYKAIGRVAASDVTVLIQGESGTGKELVARAIYQHSGRNSMPFLAINCAAIPETLLESELFGHEKGAFTGAEARRVGKFEQATGGTVFLDEIGDMSMASQAKILRVLQDQRFERVGGNLSLQADVRVVAATNQNLEELVEAGKFRRDLYHRLKVFSIKLPPLRDRGEDLRLLVDHFVKLYNRQFGKNVRSVAPEAIALLQAYAWPGNVRELQGAIKFALINSPGEVLTVDCLPESCQRPTGDHLPAQRAAAGELSDLAALVRRTLQSEQQDIYRKVLLAVERTVLGEVLRYTQGNQVEASRLLGISRTTLRGKLEATGLTIEKHVLADANHAGQDLDRQSSS